MEGRRYCLRCEKIHWSHQWIELEDQEANILHFCFEEDEYEDVLKLLEDPPSDYMQ